MSLRHKEYLKTGSGRNMDFKTVLELILKSFNRENIRYGLIGGFAMGALGLARSTVDLDFLVHRDDLDKIDKIMKSSGYECVYKSENVTQYVSAVKIFGEVDFLHAFRKVSIGMLARAKELEAFEGTLKIRVLRPEDIIGLKLQAAINNPERNSREYIDIESLIEHYKTDLDWNILEEYFSLFEQQEKFFALKAKYGNAQ